MFGLKNGTNNLSANGLAPNNLFEDISTRSLTSVLVGNSAGKLSRGEGNAFVGYESGKQNTNGSFGVFIGFQAGALNQNGNYNTFVGTYSGKANNLGDNNTFVGFRCGELNQNGSECVAIGVNAMRENTTGNRNVAVGIYSGERILDGDQNVMIGAESGQNMRSGNLNTMAGYRSGRDAFRGNENTYFGSYAGYSNSFGDANCFIGHRSGFNLRDGNLNVGVGANVLQHASKANSNVAVGSFAGSHITGSGNVYVGTGAGASNIIGDNSTIVGTEAGYNASGDDNVFLGKDAAYNLEGSKNVIIGVNAFSKVSYKSMGSVVIGFDAANNNFREGSNNIFIGVGADANIEKTSHAIAIGSRNTNAGDHNIAIGEYIDNGGTNAVSLGYNVYSDSDQCVSIGHDMVINNVIVFNDPLNWRFPVKANQEYGTFYIKEDYTDMMYLYNESNSYAIATIYASNEYDSGNNVLNGTIRTGEIDLLGAFDYNVLYSPITIQQTATTNVSTNLRAYLNELNLFRVINSPEFATMPTFTPQTPLVITNTDLSRNVLTYQIDLTGIYSISSGSVITMSSNLIPNTYSNIDYTIVIGKRITIDKIVADVNFATYQNSDPKINYINRAVTVPIRDQRQVITPSLATNEIAKLVGPNTTMSYNNKYFVKDKPRYGQTNAHIFNTRTEYDGINYTPYPEALYVSTDTFSTVLVNQITNRLSDDKNGVYVEEYDVQEQRITFDSTQRIYRNSNIYIHPDTKTIFDRSYFNIIPLASDLESKNIIFRDLDQNILMYSGDVPFRYSNITAFSMSYISFISNPITFEIVNKSIGVTKPLILIFNNIEYTYEFTYKSIVNYQNLESNINLVIDTFNMNEIVLPNVGQDFVLVEENPTFGAIKVDGTQIKFKPYTYNFGEDTFKIVTGATIGHTSVQKYINFSIKTSNVYKSLLLNKMQEVDIFDEPTYTTKITSNQSDMNVLTPLYVTNTNIRKVTLDNSEWTDPLGQFSQVRVNQLEYTEDYHFTNPYGEMHNPQQFHGYPFQSNVFDTYKYTTTNLQRVSQVIDESIITEPDNEDDGHDYIVYRDMSGNPNPLGIASRYNWDYVKLKKINSPSINKLSKISPEQNYYKIPNMSPSNRYFELEQETETQIIHRLACNLEVYTSNSLVQFDTYRDRYDNYIYVTTTSLPEEARRPLINFTCLNNMRAPVRYLRSDYTVISSKFLTRYTSTVQLQDTNVYEYDGNYALSNTSLNDGLVVLQRDIGPVSRFHQSNITNKEIHIMNMNPMTDLSILRRLYFENNKHIDIRYFENNTYIDPMMVNNPIFNFENDEVGSLHLGYLSNIGLSNIVIQHTCNISFINKNTLIPSLSYNSEGMRYQEAPVINSGFESTVYIDYINYGDRRALKPIRLNIPAVYYINKGIRLNIGLDEETTYITSKELTYIKNGLVPTDIYYKITILPPNIKIYKNRILLSTNHRFTQADIDNRLISIVGYDIRFPVETIIFTIETATAVIIQSSTNFVVNKYLHNKFLPSYTSNTSSNVILQLNDTYEHQLIGSIWDRMDEGLYVNTSTNDITMYISKNPKHGFLYSSNLGRLSGAGAVTMVNNLKFSELLTHKIHYIPYSPMILPNDTIEIFFGASNIVSPIYTISLKNYWSRWGQLVVPLNNKALSAYKIDLPTSEGMKSDGLFWTIPSLTNVTRVDLNYQNISFDLNIYPEPIAQRPYFTSITNTLTVDISNYTYLDRLLTTVDNPSNVITFFIMDPPKRGVILKQYGTNTFNAVPSFTMEDIRDKLVFYQHYGDTIFRTDTFKIKIGANNYDLSTAIQTVTVTILTSPQLFVNNYDYIYYENINDGSNIYNIIDNTRLKLSEGSIYVYDTTNIDIFKRLDNGAYVPTKLLKSTDVAQNKIYYRPSSNLFRYGSNQNENMSFKFITNNNEEIIEPNKLAIFDIYKDIFKQEWFSKYNTFDSYNDILGNIEKNQSITYTKYVNTTNNLPFENRKCRFQFDYRPYQDPLLNENNPTSVLFGNAYLAFLKTYIYTFELIDKNDHVFFKIDFKHDSIEINSYIDATTSNHLLITKDTNAGTDAGAGNDIFDFTTTNEWNKFYMINYDDTNNKELSIYFNDYNYTSYNRDGSTTFPSIDLTNLKQVRINVPFDDPLNFSGDTFQTSNINRDHYIYYNLTNFYTKMFFRNFNILLEAFDIGDFTYNVVLGDQLKINGFNNICVGKNFTTSGSGSIIIGNDIGSKPNSTTLQAGFFNEIFSSIIISSTSFINTKVRDIIAIGNNILNDAGTGPDIDAFLSKKPVIIGNDIGADMIDYHINFQNTFLKTTVGTPQIYCGYESEPVCIGYSNNQQFNDDYKLYVNGGINVNGGLEVSGPFIHSDGVDTFTKRQVFGKLRFDSGNRHTCALRINWSNPLTDYYNTFTINVKFRFIRNATSYAYYNFETWFIPVSFEVSANTILSESLQIVTAKTIDITELGHTIYRDSATSVNFNITWDMVNELTPSNYILGSLEIESVYPIELGAIVYSVTNGSVMAN